MSQLPLAPGVYVEEVSPSDLALGTPSRAVPVLLTSAGSSWWYEQQQPVLIRSLEDYFSLEGAGSASVGSLSLAAASRWLADNPSQTAVADAPGAQGFANPGSLEALALRAYFANGGTACYLCPVDQLAQVEALSEVSLVVQAGQPQEVIAGILNLCQPGSGRFALLDGPQHQGVYSAERLHDFLGEISPTTSAAIYYPWLNARWALQGGRVGTYAVPPSAVAAGLVMKTDSATGPWCAPGNLPLSSGLKPQVAVGNSAQQAFTSRDFTTPSVNMFREFPDRGAVLLGARTLTNSGPAWGYINVRRTFDRVERDLQQAMQRFLFEPNGPVTWEALRAAVEHYLYGLLRQQAFAGDSPQSSYRVEIGLGSTMTQQDILDGVMRMRIGLAVVKPAEFVFLEFSQLLGGGVESSAGLPEPLPKMIVDYELASEQLPEWPEGYTGMGYSLALSGDGTVLVVGGSGSVGKIKIIYEFQDGKWESVKEYLQLQVSEVLQISRCGDTIINGGSTCHILKKESDGWPDEWSFLINHPVGFRFKNACNLSSDGTKVAREYNGINDNENHVFIFSDDDDYQNPVDLPYSGQRMTYFGSSLAFSADNKLFVGDCLRRQILPYQFDGENWIEPSGAEIINNAEGALIGFVTDVNDAGTLLVTKTYPSDSDKNGVYIYAYLSSKWYQVGYIDDKGERLGLGENLKISANGKVIVASSANGFNEKGDKTGAVWVITQRNGKWQVIKKITPQEEQGTVNFGHSIDITPDGEFITVGAPGDRYNGGLDVGNVFIYQAVKDF